MVLALCSAVVVGSAFVLRARLAGAEFAALDVLGVNHLATGRLDIDVGESTTSLTVLNMAPGDTAFGRLEVANAGTLPLVYSVGAAIDDAGLASSLTFSLWTGGDCLSVNRPGLLIDGVPMARTGTAPVLGDPATGRQPGDRSLDVGEREVLCYSVGLPLDASNEAQGARGRQTFTIFAEHDIERPAGAPRAGDP